MPTGVTVEVGTVSRRADGNYVKATDTGPHAKRWMRYSRWLWETVHGPVPQGKRIAHADGDIFNDDIRNLVAVAPGDVLWIHCHSDKRKSNANYRKCRKATAKMNRERAAWRRQREWLPSKWYAINEANGLVLNQPHRTVVGVARLLQLPCDARKVHPVAMGFPNVSRGEAVALRCLQEPAAETAELLTRAHSFAALVGFRPMSVGRLRTCLYRLRQAGMITGQRHSYARTIQPQRQLLIVRAGCVPNFPDYRATESADRFLSHQGTP